MFEHQEDVVERIVRQLRQPVDIDPALDRRVMQEIATLPGAREVGALTAAWRWLTRPRPIAVSPLAGLAVAAVVVILSVLPALRRVGAPPPAAPVTASRAFQFVLVAPRAATVSLVGDFNDWDAGRTPMRADGAVWTAVLPLSPGRYRYAFLVNGARWVADPGAPAAPDDGFGRPSSVVTVGGRGS